MKTIRVGVNPACNKCGKAKSIMDIAVDIRGLFYLLHMHWYCPFCQEETDGSTSFEELCVQARCTVCKAGSPDVEEDKYDRLLREMSDDEPIN